MECCLLTDATALRRQLFGALHAGSLFQLNGLHSLPQVLLIELTGWLDTVAKALAKLPSPANQQQQQQQSSRAPSPSSLMPSNASLLREMSEAGPKTPSFKQQESTAPPPSQVRAYSHRLPPGRPLDMSASSLASPQSSRHLPSNLERTRVSSRGTTAATTTRLDWYQMSQEHHRADQEVDWFGYGGEERRCVEVGGSEVFCVSPAFGCILVTDKTLCLVSEQLKVRLHA